MNLHHFNYEWRQMKKLLFELNKIYRNLQGNHYSQFEAGLKFAVITNYSKQKIIYSQGSYMT